MMDRRSLIRTGLHVAAASTLPFALTAGALPRFTSEGRGPALLGLERQPGFFDQLANRYRIVSIEDPPVSPIAAVNATFTAERVCSDILATADAVGAEHFAWFGYSWGAVIGLQLASRTSRLTALVLGGWPPLGGQYAEASAVAALSNGPAHAFYQSIQGWNERDAVSQLSCPRLIFVGEDDEFVAEGHRIRHAAIIAEHREELQRLGWTVRVVSGIGHELGFRRELVAPLVGEFLDGLPLSERV
jgi:dienelactone hydrolase